MIVENKEKLLEFTKLHDTQESIVIPIFSDDNKQPVQIEVCLLYIQLMSGKEFILPFNHSETLNIDVPVLKSKFKKYTYDRKKLNHFIELDNVIDINFLHYMATNESLNIEHIDTNAHHFFNMMYYRKKNVNTIIPILKHLEYCRELATILKDTIEKYGEYVNMSYNNDVLDNLTHIEHNGLQTINDVVYSEYNTYTSTGRPSNRFGGINFAALNKKDGSRKPFVSRFENGMLVEFDFDGYHLRLIADKIGYEFPEGSVHEHMAKLYGVDYNEAKGLSFQYLYGYIPDEIKQNNEYFNKVSIYINALWDDYKSKEFIVSDIYNKKIFRKNLTDMNANKLFNYTIQLMETENNMKVLSDLIPKMKDYKSKLILYSYDSFLVDFNMDDGLNFLYEVKKIIERKGKFPVKVAKGLNYHEMEDITEKFSD